jgi:phage RecT family recombinase
MSELTVHEAVGNFIDSQQETFQTLNNGSLNELHFASEASYARQHLCKNDYTLQIARSNRASLIDAIGNVASIGLSLNPAYSHAYLVPRKIGADKAICLDISYRGMIKLATDTGVIEYLKAELVYENDTFEYRGFNQAPVIASNPFKDRGELIGVYAMAKLTAGGFLVETMTINEVNEIRNDSEAFKGALKKGVDSWGYLNTVWVKYYTEMVKKTAIKRLYKTLPQTGAMAKLGDAIDMLNQHEGIDFQHQQKPQHDYTDEHNQAYKFCLDNNDYVGLLCLRDAIGYEGCNQLWKIHEEPRIEPKGKGKYSKLMDDNTAAARQLRDGNTQRLIELAQSSDEAGINEILEECNKWEIEYYNQNMPSDINLNQIIKAA